MSPGLIRYGFDFAGPPKAFVAVARWLTDEERSAFIARGLELAFGTLSWVESAQEAALTSEMNQDILRKALLPDINYDGLLSVLPAADAAVACDWVRQVVSGHKLLGAWPSCCRCSTRAAAGPSPTNCSRRPPRSSRTWIVTGTSYCWPCRPSWPQDWPTG